MYDVSGTGQFFGPTNREVVVIIIVIIIIIIVFIRYYSPPIQGKIPMQFHIL